MSLEINKQDFAAKVLQAEGAVLVDFWAPWCGPCKMLGPIIDQIATEHPEIAVYKVNVDEQQELAQQYGVTSIPTVISFANGTEKARQVGSVPKDKILALV